MKIAIAGTGYVANPSALLQRFRSSLRAAQRRGNPAKQNACAAAIIWTATSQTCVN